MIDVSNPARPSVVGSVSMEYQLSSVAVSGRYAYVANLNSSTLQVIDVSNPTSPWVVGSVGTGDYINSVAVSGRYAYVANYYSNALLVIDVSNPASPSVVGSVGTGSNPSSVAVTGRYAYVVNDESNTLQVIDVSNPAAPSVVGSVLTGGEPYSVAVSGRYAYVGNLGFFTLQVIDVSDPASPSIVGSVLAGGEPWSIAVSGRYAYVANPGSYTLQVIDVTGMETTAMDAHSLEAGTLQVRGSAFVGDQLSVRGGLNVGASGNFAGTVAANGVALTSDARFKTNIHGLSGSLESVMKLRGVSFDWKRDEFADRNFSDQPQIGLIAQEVEKVFPELVTKDSQGYRAVEYQNLVPVLIEAIKEMKTENDELKVKTEEIDSLKARLAALEELLKKGN